MNRDLPNLKRLLDLQRWDEVRVALTRLDQYSFSYRNKILIDAAGKYLYDVPQDILSSLLEGTDDADAHYVLSVSGWWGVKPMSKFRLLLAKAVPMSSTLAIGALWTTYLQGRYLLRPNNTRRSEMEEDMLSVTSVEMLREKASQGQLQDLHQLWEKTELLFKATKKGRLDQPIEEMGLIHWLIQEEVCNPILWFALRMYPKLAKSKDPKTGQLPLHVAAIHNNKLQGRAEPLDSRVKLGRGKTLVEIVLARWPDAAKCPDAKGLLPLHLLLDRSREPHQPHPELLKRERGERRERRERRERKDRVCREWTVRSAKALVKANPDALNKKDKKGMLPFMSAACMRLGTLELIYHILSSNPSVLTGGTSGLQDDPPVDLAKGKDLDKKLGFPDNVPVDAPKEKDLVQELAEANRKIAILEKEVKRIPSLEKRVVSLEKENKSLEEEVKLLREEARDISALPNNAGGVDC